MQPKKTNSFFCNQSGRCYNGPGPGGRQGILVPESFLRLYGVDDPVQEPDVVHLGGEHLVVAPPVLEPLASKQRAVGGKHHRFARPPHKEVFFATGHRNVFDKIGLVLPRGNVYVDGKGTVIHLESMGLPVS